MIGFPDMPLIQCNLLDTTPLTKNLVYVGKLQINLYAEHEAIETDCSSVILEKAPRFRTEAIGNAGNVVDRYVSLGTFDSADIGPVDPAHVGKSFLAERKVSPQAAHVLGQNVAQRAFMRAFHPAKGS